MTDPSLPIPQATPVVAGSPAPRDVEPDTAPLEFEAPLSEGASTDPVALVAGGFPGELAQDYEPLAELGAGGMGRVWLARDRRLDLRVAVKLLVAGDRGPERQRLRREAEALRRFDHPNVVRVFRHGVHRGVPYLVLEYLEGVSIDQAPRPFDPTPAMLQVADGLEAVHRAGLVHRDVKPGNVVLTTWGRAVLVDFGLAQAEEDTQITREGLVAGTASFMAPERLRGDPGGPPADWFAWGASLYSLYEGRPPWSVPELVRIAAGQAAPLPTFEVLSLESRAAATILRLLDPQPLARPDSREEIEALLGGEGADATRPVLGLRSSEVRRRRRETAVGPFLRGRHGGAGGEVTRAAAAPRGGLRARGEGAPRRGGVGALVAVALTLAVSGALALWQVGVGAPEPAEAAVRRPAVAAPEAGQAAGASAEPAVGAPATGPSQDAEAGRVASVAPAAEGARRAAPPEDLPLLALEGSWAVAVAQPGGLVEVVETPTLRARFRVVPLDPGARVRSLAWVRRPEVAHGGDLLVAWGYPASAGPWRSTLARADLGENPMAWTVRFEDELLEVACPAPDRAVLRFRRRPLAVIDPRTGDQLDRVPGSAGTARMQVDAAQVRFLDARGQVVAVPLRAPGQGAAPSAWAGGGDVEPGVVVEAGQARLLREGRGLRRLEAEGRDLRRPGPRGSAPGQVAVEGAAAVAFASEEEAVVVTEDGLRSLAMASGALGPPRALPEGWDPARTRVAARGADRALWGGGSADTVAVLGAQGWDLEVLRIARVDQAVWFGPGQLAVLGEAPGGAGRLVLLDASTGRARSLPSGAAAGPHAAVHPVAGGLLAGPRQGVLLPIRNPAGQVVRSWSLGPGTRGPLSIPPRVNAMAWVDGAGRGVIAVPGRSTEDLGFTAPRPLVEVALTADLRFLVGVDEARVWVLWEVARGRLLVSRPLAEGETWALSPRGGWALFCDPAGAAPAGGRVEALHLPSAGA